MEGDTAGADGEEGRKGGAALLLFSGLAVDFVMLLQYFGVSYEVLDRYNGILYRC